MVQLDTRPAGDLAGTDAAPVRRPPGGPAMAADEPPLLDLAPVLREAPPWLVSAIVHMLAMIVLGLWLAKVKSEPQLELQVAYEEQLGESLDDLDLANDEHRFEESVLTPDRLPIVDDPLALPNVSPVLPMPAMPTGPVVSTTIGLALKGREVGMKEALLKAYGGNARTEGAVALGLRWLANRQRNDGLWSLRGPYTNGANDENVEAATAMALLAFQGAGYTPDSDPKDPFTKTVDRGWNALLRKQDDDGRFFHDVPNAHQLYTQAQCTMALCELYAMTRDEKYFLPAQRAVDYCVRIQSPLGGWRYSPGSDSDMSVTGWFVMALQSARMAGIEVPSPVFEKINEFLDSVARDGGSRYAYQLRSTATLSLTAEGLLCRQYLGWKRDDPRLVAGVEYMLKYPPNWRDRNVYYWYYATQVLHHMEGEHWRQWNEVMRKLLPEEQETSGRERGSWDPQGDRYGGAGGRLYVTCLSIYMLEVYYRHLPLYQTGLLDLGR
jgi:hypothetical protein